MSKVEAEFAFELGDLVYLKTANHGIFKTPRLSVVTGRIAEECTGGVQNHYVIAIDQHSVKVHELCLSKERPPYVFPDEKQLEQYIEFLNKTDRVETDTP